MKKILIVDDHAFVKAFYLLAFKEWKFELIFAYDGEEAVERARESIPDLIIMDINLPRMDGVNATRNLRAHPELAKTPVVAVTARPFDDYLQSAGFDRYLKKPVSASRIREVIVELTGE